MPGVAVLKRGEARWNALPVKMIEVCLRSICTILAGIALCHCEGEGCRFAGMLCQLVHKSEMAGNYHEITTTRPVGCNLDAQPRKGFFYYACIVI
jgi:hypothetical protein